MDIINNNESGLAVRNKLNDNFTELKSLIDDLKGALIPQGNWDANANSPDISAETETGYYWIVSAEGVTNIGGITDWKVNDWIIKTATGWAKIDNTDDEKANITYVDAADLILQDSINAEATARADADNALQDNINAETTARAETDNALQVDIDANANKLATMIPNSYTPVTYSGNVNTQTITFNEYFYYRVGDWVIVFGRVYVDVTSLNILTTVYHTLPIKSNFTNSADAIGSGGTSTSNVVAIIAADINALNGGVYLNFYPQTDKATYQYSFMYHIK